MNNLFQQGVCGLIGRINTPIGSYEIEDMATKVGKCIDFFTGGRTDFESIGRAIDEATEDKTIDINILKK